MSETILSPNEEAPNPRPIAVTVLAIVYIVVGAGGIVSHFGDLGSIIHVSGLGIALIGVLAIVAGVFMLRAQNWARWLAVAWIAFHVAVSAMHAWSELAIHCLFFIVIVWGLFRRGATIYFRGAQRS